jgi:hypothetical protein
MVLATALALAPATAFAQTTPTQPSSPMPMASTGPATVASPAPDASQLPSSGGTISTSPAPASSGSGSASGATKPGNGGVNGANNGNHLGQVKQIKRGSLSLSQVKYGLTHPLQEAKQLKSMKTVSFDNLRVYKLPTTLKSVLKVSDADTQLAVLAVLGNGVQVAQTTGLPATNGNNSPIQYLRDVLANINVSNALNNLNVLNNSNLNVNVALQNVLNNNKISIGQVVGLYIGGGGIITTITN